MIPMFRKENTMDDEIKTNETPENGEPDKDEKPEKPGEPEKNEQLTHPASVPESKPEHTEPDETAALRSQLARANAERIAAIEAAKLGVDPNQVPYVLRLAEFPESGKPEDIAAAVQKVLDDVPAFKASAPGNRPEIRIGAKAPKEHETSDALARAFGNK